MARQRPENPVLFDERVVAVQPSLVRAVGSVTAAAVLQQVHYHAQAGHVQEDGWVARTYADLGREIGLTEEQARRAVGKLESLGLMESCQPEGHVRRKWYRIAYDSAVLSGMSNRQNRRMEAAESPVPSGQFAASSSTERTRVKDPGYVSLVPTTCGVPGCLSGWITTENGDAIRCECAA